MLKFSVVINTYNRAAYINDAILGLAELNYPDYEVIVINGPSTDRTGEILEGWKERIKIGECAEANLSMSRNIGIQMASGDVVAFMDDDAVPHPEWLKRLAVHYADPSVGGVGGFTIDNTGVRYQVRKTVCDRFGNAFFPHDYFDERPLSFLERLFIQACWARTPVFVFQLCVKLEVLITFLPIFWMKLMFVCA